ncbi:MAG: type II toxin-antitoxin system RelE family toxin [Spirosomataceae bacterium]
MKTEFKNSFLKELQKLKDQSLKDAIFQVIIDVENATNLNDIPNIKKLKGYSNYFRIRVKDYRIGLKLENETLFFVTFDHRKDIYKRFP